MRDGAAAVGAVGGIRHPDALDSPRRAAGIADRERSESTNLLANVSPTFAWVRLAQRVPVRIALDPSPEASQLTVGRTATVVVHPAGGPEPRPLGALRRGWEALKGNLAGLRRS